MSAMTHIRNPLEYGGYDGTQRQYDQTYAALNRLATTKGVPAETAIQARVFRDTVYLTGRITGMKPWIVTEWSRHMVNGSIGGALVAGLFMLLALHGHPLLSVIGFIVATVGVYRGSRWVKRRTFVARGRLPKVGKGA